MSHHTTTLLPVTRDSFALRRQSFLKLLANIIILAYLPTIPLSGFILLTNENKLFSLGLLMTGFVGGSVGWVCRKLSMNPARVQLGSWLLIGYVTLNIASSIVVLGTNLPLSVGMFIPVSMSLFLLPWQATFVIAALNLLATIAVYLLTIFAGYTSPLVLPANINLLLSLGIWLLDLIVSTSLVIWIARQLKQAYNTALERTAQAERTLAELEHKQNAGQAVTQNITSLSAELNATAVQQADGAISQANAIIEATTSMEELGQSAEQIAGSAQQVANAAAKSLATALAVKAESSTAQNVAERGSIAVKTSIESSLMVNNQIENLTDQLRLLTERSEQIVTILNLISSIADETRLLSLNAAIEAAGAGEYGLRFGIIATEVKSLADRAADNTKGVRGFVDELQSAVQKAVQAAEESRKTTANAVASSRQSGDVIGELTALMKNADLRGAQLVEYANTVAQLAEEIRMSTQQQQSAGQQVIVMLREVGNFSQEVTTSSTQVTVSAQRLNNLSAELSSALGLEELRESELIAV